MSWATQLAALAAADTPGPLAPLASIGGSPGAIEAIRAIDCQQHACKQGAIGANEAIGSGVLSENVARLADLRAAMAARAEALVGIIEAARAEEGGPVDG